MKLVYIKDKYKEPYTLSSVIAEYAEVQHRTVKRLVTKHKESLETFGKVRFEISPSASGQNERNYMLNEQQATLLITFMRNTDKVIEFKKALVKAFYDMRAELMEFRKQRTLESIVHRELEEAINQWEHKNAHSFVHINNLIMKHITGYNVKQLKKIRGDTPSALDLLTSKELKKYRFAVLEVVPLLMYQWKYDEMKDFLEKKIALATTHPMSNC